MAGVTVTKPKDYELIKDALIELSRTPGFQRRLYERLRDIEERTGIPAVRRIPDDTDR